MRRRCTRGSRWAGASCGRSRTGGGISSRARAPELYDLERDPRETRDLAAAEPAVAARLAGRARASPPAAARPPGTSAAGSRRSAWPPSATSEARPRAGGGRARCPILGPACPSSGSSSRPCGGRRRASSRRARPSCAACLPRAPGGRGASSRWATCSSGDGPARGCGRRAGRRRRRSGHVGRRVGRARRGPAPAGPSRRGGVRGRASPGRTAPRARTSCEPASRSAAATACARSARRRPRAGERVRVPPRSSSPPRSRPVPATWRARARISTRPIVWPARCGSTAVPGLDFQRGDVLARLGRPAEAEAAYRREIARYPRHLQAWANLGVLLYLQAARRGRRSADGGDGGRESGAGRPRGGGRDIRGPGRPDTRGGLAARARGVRTGVSESRQEARRRAARAPSSLLHWTWRGSAPRLRSCSSASPSAPP